MDNQESLTQNFELPKPAGAATPEAGLPHVEQGPAPEQQAAPGTSGPDPSNMPPLIPDPALATGGAAPAAPTVTSAHSMGMSADDADLIEKDWILKAKQIVSHTHGDPYSQNKEINKMKADYIKKRYNKDIKLMSE